jgi:hypothetical protein
MNYALPPTIYVSIEPSIYVEGDLACYSVVVPVCWRCFHMREVAGSTPGLDFHRI